MKKTILRAASAVSILWVFAGIASVVFFAPVPIDLHLNRMLGGIEWRHPLGFDAFGRDLLLVTLRASMTSSLFAAIAATASCIFGVLAGSSLVLLPARAQSITLRALEGILAFPYLLFALAWATVLGPGWGVLLFALLVGSVPSLTRLIYLRAKELMVEDYILAAQSLGVSPTRIVRHHLSPALLSLCSAKAPILFAQALMAEATLSFLGMGAPLGHDTWGSLLAQGKDYLIEAPHIALGSGLPLVAIVLCLQIFSDRAATN